MRLAFALLVLLASAVAHAGMLGQSRDSNYNIVIPSTGTPITTPIFMTGGSATAPSTAANQDNALITSAATVWATGLSNKAFPVPIAGTFKGLEVSAPSLSAWTAGSDAFALNASASTGTMTCSLSSTNPTGCSDQSGSIHVAAGATVAIQSTPSTAPAPAYTNTTPAPFKTSVVFVGDNNQESMIFGGSNGGSLSASALNWMGAALSPNATESLVSVIMPTAGTLDSLYVVLSGTPGASASYNFIVFKNGQAQTVSAGDGVTTCAGTGGGATACQDTAGCSAGALTCTHSVAVVAGDTISVEACPSTVGNTLTCPNVAGTPAAPTARDAIWGMRFVPTTTNQTVVFGTPSTLPPTTVSVTRFFLVNGTGAADSTNTNELMVLPYTTGVTQTYANPIVGYCWTGTAAAGATHATSWDASAGSPTIATTVPVGTAACPAAGSQIPFTQGTGSYATANPVVDGTTVDFKHVNTGTAGQTYTEFKYSVTAVIH